MATIIEVAVSDKGVLTIPRIDVAVDCGPQVNPDRIRSQIEGACIMGVSLATTGEITFKNGKVEQENFHNYEVTRIDTAPRDIRVHMVSTAITAGRCGVGEPAVPPIAPAYVTHLCGYRQTDSPVTDS
jgi:isoquinoline 1-oxidoreductase beta subunit